MRKILPLLLFIPLFWSLAASAQPSPLHAALSPQLAESRAWRSLLHYTDDHPSKVTAGQFFFATNGNTSPDAELHATLDALLSNPDLPQRGESVRCAFPARYRLLASALGPAFTDAAPMPACPRRSEWMAALAGDALWLVYPSGYLNSPSSMFGHTLLRLDSAESRARGPLLAYAANFVAQTQESNGLLFAYLGLTGGYKGAYAVLPYYEKIREYVRMESRDVWEYPLHLSPLERQQALEHLWELRSAQFTYYFLTQNCGYQLLALMQTLRPEKDLMGSFDGWAIPSDTLRRLFDEGWLGAPQFRPALASSLAARGAQLSPPALQLAAAIAAGQQPPEAASGDPQQSQILDVAHDRIYLHFQSGGDREALLGRDRKILAARAAVGGPSQFAPLPSPAIAPHQGHRTERLAAAVQAREGASGLLLSHRFAYHDLLDAPGGYIPGAAISFLDATARLDSRANAIKLEDLRLIEITSLAPRSVLASPFSWRFALGARRPVNGALNGFVEGAPGLAWGQRWMRYAYTPLSFDSGPGLAGGYSLRAGLELGTLLQTSPHSRLQASSSWQAGLAGDSRWLAKATLAGQLDLSPSWGLRLSTSPERYAHEDWQWRGSVGLLHYF